MDTNDIMNVVDYTIKSAFPGVNVFKENVIQGTEFPFFLVEEIESKYNHAIGRKYKKQVSLLIKYFSNSELNVKKEIYSVSERLADILELMQYELIVLKGINSNSKIIDNVLNFSIDVRVNELKDKNTNKFGQLEVDVNVKE